MNDRTTAKSNIVGLNVPSVTNAVMNQMLNDNICDNVVFRKDVTGPPLAFGLSNINLDFTGKDRLDITRTGGSLNITVAGIEDGERKFLLITKTPGEGITWVGVIDITPVTAYVSLAAVVLYEIVRKGSLYIANAWLKTIQQATDAYQGILAIATESQCNDLTVVNKIVTPGRIPIASDTQKGVIEIATQEECNAMAIATKAITPVRIPIATTTQKGVAKFATSAQIDAGTDSDQGGSLVVIPSELKRKYDAAVSEVDKVGTDLFWYGQFFYSNNSMVQYAGSGTVTLGTDFGDGSWEFLINQTIDKEDAIVNVIPSSSNGLAYIKGVTLENNLENGLLRVIASADTNLFITIHKLR
jgi:hypothetical protein